MNTNSAIVSPFFDLLEPFSLFSPFYNLRKPNRNKYYAPSSPWLPPLDIKENDHQIVILVDLPGFKKEDIQLDVQDDVLTLSGERKEIQNKDNEKELVRNERWTGKFQRRIRLTHAVDNGKVSATIENGILEIIIPKTKISSTQKIDIKAKL